VSGAAPRPAGAGPAAGTVAARRDRGRDAGRRLRRLRDADLVVVSFRKSGRTWLRAMLSHLCHRRYGVPEGELLEFDNLHRLDPRIPRVFFTHDLPWDPWNRWWRRLLRPEPFRGKRVLLLVRDPRDATVSLHFQLAKREPPGQRRREGLPAAGVPPLAEFLLDPRHGQLARCVAFLNRWAARSRKLPGVVLLRYEDLHADAAGGLRRAAGLLGDFAEEEIRAAVAFAAFDSLREKEARGFFRSGRLRPGDPGDPDSFKVRRGRVGGWRDYLTADQAARVDDLVAARLDPALGYGAGRPPAPPPRAGRSPRTG
jgi:alcohol sulfotransferase